MFASSEDVRLALRELHDLGFDSLHLEVFAGPEGAALLDLSGEAHATAARVMRNIEALFLPQDAKTMREAESSLESGGIAVAVHMDGRESLKTRVGAILKAHHGKLVRRRSQAEQRYRTPSRSGRFPERQQ